MTELHTVDKHERHEAAIRAFPVRSASERLHRTSGCRLNKNSVKCALAV